MLKEGITNKKYLAIAASFLLLLLCYQLAFKKTFEALSANRELKAKLAQVSDLSYQPGFLERKNKNLDTILSRYHLDSLALRENKLADLARIAAKENVKLSEVPVIDPAFRTDRFIIERLSFEGAFPSLLKLLGQLENDSEFGVPREVIVKVKKKNGTSGAPDALSMELFLEVSK